MMGMYTEFLLRCELKEDTPDEVIGVINLLANGSWEDRKDAFLPDHPFFKCDRTLSLFRCSSYMFPQGGVSRFQRDDITKSWHLFVRSSLKNYDNEIDLFMDWIDQHIDAYTGDFLGYSLYEEEDTPTLLLKKEDSDG